MTIIKHCLNRGVRVVQTLYVLFCRSLFVLFLFGLFVLYVVFCPSVYGF